MNPAFRSSSPQPSTYESHHDPESTLAQSMSGRVTSESQPNPLRSSQNQVPPANPSQDVPKVPHNEYPQDGMTQFCRIGPPSERSSIPSPTRPEDFDDRSDYSQPTSYSSFEPSSGNQSPVKQFNESNISSSSDDRSVQKKKSAFFQSPFRRRSKHESQYPQSDGPTPSSHNTWADPSTRDNQNSSPARPFGRANNGFAGPGASSDPDPVDPRANFQLNVGNNVFDVASPDSRRKPSPQKTSTEDDPIAAALAELKGVTKNASVRISADRYHGIATPAPPGTPGANDRTPINGPPRPFAGQELRAGRGITPPPSYDQPVSRLGAPQPAFTSKQMKQTTASYVSQGRDMYASPGRGGPQEPRSQSAMGSRPGTRDGQIPRATSPAPLRSTSPRPYMNQDPRGQQHMRATSPNPYGRPGPNGAPPNGGPGRPRAQSNSPTKQQGGFPPNGYNSSPGQMPRARSPQPGYGGSAGRSGSRPPSSRGSDNGGGMAMQLAGNGDPNQRGRGSFNGAPRPTSQMYRSDGPYAAAAGGGGNPGSQGSRNRSQSAAGHRQVNKEGRPILHFGKSANIEDGELFANTQ